MDQSWLPCRPGGRFRAGMGGVALYDLRLYSCSQSDLRRIVGKEARLKKPH
jgi:hypothetical protein